MIYYGGSTSPIHIEDSALAHLKVVITTKLRRRESFTMSWPDRDGSSGRSSIWLHPAVQLMFVFEDAERPELNPRYLADLASAANSTGGIHLSAEDVARCTCSSHVG